MGAGHPECPDRVRVIDQSLRQNGLLQSLDSKLAPKASDEQILRVHSAEHLLGLRAVSPKVGYAALDPDTTMNPHTLEAALFACGAGASAVDQILAGNAVRAFCNVRPPGHHAQRNRAMGFCFFNSIAVAAAHALAGGLERVCMIDFDVHHGNGTEDIFANDERVLMLSTFQTRLYPFSGDHPLGKNMMHCPLTSGSDGQALREAVLQHWWPAIESFKPQMIFVSAGFDAHQADQLASIQWNDQDYVWVTEQIVKMADQFAQGRIVSMLEGGYDLNALARCASLHVAGLCQPAVVI